MNRSIVWLACLGDAAAEPGERQAVLADRAGRAVEGMPRPSFGDHAADRRPEPARRPTPVARLRAWARRRGAPGLAG